MYTLYTERNDSYMLEKQIENYFVQLLQKRKCLCWKFVSPGIAGVPDRIIILPFGKVVFAEIKAPGGKLRKLQKIRCKQLEMQNVDVWQIDSKEKIEKFIKYYGLDLYE